MIMMYVNHLVQRIQANFYRFIALMMYLKVTGVLKKTNLSYYK